MQAVQTNSSTNNAVQEMHNYAYEQNRQVKLYDVIQQVKLHFAKNVERIKFREDYDVFVRMNSEKKFFIELKKNYIINLLNEIAKIFIENNYCFRYKVKEVNAKHFVDINNKTNYIVYVIVQISVANENNQTVLEVEDVAESLVRVQETAEYRDTVCVRIAETRALARVINKLLDNLLFYFLEEISQSLEQYYNTQLSVREKDYLYNIFYEKNTKKVDEFITKIHENSDIEERKIYVANIMIENILNS